MGGWADHLNDILVIAHRNHNAIHNPCIITDGKKTIERETETT